MIVSLKPLTWREWQVQNGGKRWYWRWPSAACWFLKQADYRLRRLPFFELLESIAVVAAVVFWFSEADDRAKERHYRAWELINAARGSTGDGGRKDALQDLNKDGVSLAAAPLEKAWLPKVDLKGAHLSSTNLTGAHLWGANLQDADLFGADLQGAVLAYADLRGAVLWDANLQGTGLAAANLQDAVLHGANLQNARLDAANLQGANLTDASLQGANLRDARNLTQGQLDADGDDQTVLPAGLTRPAHWTRTEAPVAPPAAQPDAAAPAPAPSDAPSPAK